MCPSKNGFSDVLALLHRLPIEALRRVPPQSSVLPGWRRPDSQSPGCSNLHRRNQKKHFRGKQAPGSPRDVLRPPENWPRPPGAAPAPHFPGQLPWKDVPRATRDLLVRNSNLGSANWTSMPRPHPLCSAARNRVANAGLFPWSRHTGPVGGIPEGERQAGGSPAGVDGIPVAGSKGADGIRAGVDSRADIQAER